MEALASVFGIDVLTYAIMSNHLHVILRNLPDVVEGWSDGEVALRWLKVFPGRRLAEPTDSDIERLVADAERMSIVRRRLSDEQAGKHLRETSVGDRKHQRRAKRRNPTGKQILRDRWLAPLTQSERKMADDPEAHRQGVRASDKGFLGLAWDQYLALLRWTAEQRVKGQVAKVPEKLRGILGELGIEASMWRDLVWDYNRYFGRSTCAGSPSAMSADAQRTGKHHRSGQRLVRECFFGTAG